MYITQLYAFLHIDLDISGSGNSVISPTTDTSYLPQDAVYDDQFIKINGTCFPQCDSFEQSPHDVTVVVQNMYQFSACHRFTVGIFVLL